MDKFEVGQGGDKNNLGNRGALNPLVLLLLNSENTCLVCHTHAYKSIYHDIKKNKKKQQTKKKQYSKNYSEKRMSNPRFYPVPTHISKPKQTDARFTQFLETIQPAKTKRGERKLNKNGEFVSTTHETAVEEPSSSEEESSDEESEMEEEEIEEIEDILHTKDVTFKEEKSNRLAIVNLDWAHIKV